MGKSNSKIIFALLVLTTITFFISSCTTRDLEEVARIVKETPAPDPDVQGNPGPYSQYSDARAVLVATKTKTAVVGTVFSFGTAVAVFYANPGDDEFIEAGTVSVEGVDLDLMDNKSYAYTAGAKSSTVFPGIEFTNPILWEVSGAGSVTSFTHGLTGNFPNTDTITSSKTINKNSSYTLRVAGVSHADSVLFNIGAANGTRVTKTLPGNANSCTFTAAELSVLEGSVGIAQVAPYRVTSAVYSGRKNYFVREIVSSQNVTIN